MIKNIEYKNKEALQNDESVADKNKVTDGDMNEIKNVVNNNALALKLINSQIPTGQASGENITLNDSSDLSFESFKIIGNSIQSGTPTSENPVAIENVTSVNIKICNKNLLTDKFEDYDITSGSYGYKEIAKEFSKKYLILTIRDKDTSVDISNIFFGFTGNGINAIDGNSWIVSNGTVLGTELSEKRYISTDNLRYFSFYPNNEATFNKIFNRFNIIIGLSDENEPFDYIEHQSQTFSFPLSEGQKLYKDSYLADDGIHHVRTQYEFDGTENWQVSDNKYYVGVKDKVSRTTAVSDKILCNYFAENKTGYNNNTTVGKMFENYYTTGNKNVFFNYDDGEGGVNNFKTWLSTKKSEGNPIILEYELAEEVIEPYTEEQQTVYDQIKQAYSYKNVTNIFSLDEMSPIFEVIYKKDLETMLDSSTYVQETDIETITDAEIDAMFSS